MPKELPILFTGDMVSAILEDRKTMTRRLKGLSEINKRPDDYVFKGMRIYSDENLYAIFWDKESNNDGVGIKCPYGKPGDLLYVREAWQLIGWSFEDGMATVRYADGTTDQLFYCIDGDYDNADDWLTKKVEKLVRKGYYAPSDNPDDENLYRTEKPYPFEPSIYMPKWASRIWLQIEDIRVERLQSISEDDAMKEGSKKLPLDDLGNSFFTYKRGFQTIWESINGPESWEEKPYVWVISFKVLSTIGKPENI